MLGEHAEISAAFDQGRSQREAFTALADHGLRWPRLRVAYDLLRVIHDRLQVPLIFEALGVNLGNVFRA
jgi:hypothetical protein